MKKTVAFALAAFAVVLASSALFSLQAAVVRQDDMGWGPVGPSDYAFNAFAGMGEMALALAFLYIASKLFVSKTPGFAFQSSPYALPPIAAAFALFTAGELLSIVNYLSQYTGYYWSWTNLIFMGIVLGVFLDIALAANAKFWETKTSKLIDVAFTAAAPERKRPARRRRR